MKKKLLIVVSVVVLVLSLSVFAENGIHKLWTVGNYQVFATSFDIIPPPHGQPITVYRNIGVMDKDGNYVVPPVCYSLSSFEDGRARFCLNDSYLYGYFDENFNVAIEPVYKSALDFSEGLAAVADKSGKYGYIDKDGKLVIPHTYYHASPFVNGLATVGFSDEGYNLHTFVREGKIDKNGNIAEPIKYNWQNEYDVQMSQNNINIMGTVYKNSDLEYPFINYLGYTYMPLSFYTCMSLGFATTWNSTDGLGITPPNSVSVPARDGVIFGNLLGKHDMVEGRMFKAKLYRGSVTIGGETYTADDVYYPLLTYRDVVYIPVLWRQGMEGLGLNYSYDLETTSLVFETVE